VSGEDVRAVVGAVLIGLTGILLPAGPAAAASAPIYRFHIAAQPISKALEAFAAQANLSIAYPDDLARVRGNALDGRYSGQQALSRLLSGTGLDFTFVDGETVQVVHRPAAVAATPAQQSSALESVTVTGTKRPALLEELPNSAAVVNGDRLVAADILSTDQLMGALAAFSTTNLGPGRNKIFLRGLSDGSFSGRVQSMVGIYLDNTPINFSAPDPDIQLIDMERVEVLRGPQGTLYGSGSIGGIYRMVTRKPDPHVFGGWISFRGSTTEGGDQGASISGAVNVPLVEDRLAARIVGYRLRETGYIDDIRMHENNINGSDISGARGMLRWILSDRWTLDLSATFQRIEQHDSQYAVAEAGPYKRQNFVAQPYLDDLTVGSATLHAELDWASLTSSTSVVGREVDQQNDATLGVPRFVPLSGIPSPFLARRDIAVISHETRLVSPAYGSLRWLAGLFFLRNREIYDATLTVPGAAGLLNSPSDVVYSESRREVAVEAAAFGELEWYLSDSLSLTGGLRVSRNHTGVVSGASGPALSASSAVEALTSVNASRARTSVLPKAALSYRLDDDLTVYLRAEQGFRMGGINIVRGVAGDGEDANGFDPDRLWNFDLGVKSRWFDDRLQINAAIFYILWRDVQTEQLLANGLTYVTNAGTGRNVGIELEMVARPVDGLEISANLLFNEPELYNLNPALGLNPKEARLPGIADMTAGVDIAYNFPLTAGFEGRVAFAFAYTGHSRLLFDKTLSPIMGDYHVGNLMLSASRGGLTLGVSVDNLWNTAGNTFAFGNPFSLPFEHQTTPLRPRTFSLFARYAF
jgi:iron complex outermembrane receptor protein